MIRFLRRFLRSERGSATVEFVILFPVMFGMLLQSFEQGMYLVRQVSLDRSLDLAVREVRLGALDDEMDSSLSGSEQSAKLHDAVKERLCDYSFALPDCMNQVRLEMQRVDPRNWDMLDNVADCPDRADPGRPIRRFTPGESNDLMVLRACILIDPYFPTSGLGARLEKVSGGAFAIVSMQSFALEPQED